MPKKNKLTIKNAKLVARKLNEQPLADNEIVRVLKDLRTFNTKVRKHD